MLLNLSKHHHTEKFNVSYKLDKERFPKLKTRDVRHDKRSPPVIITNFQDSPVYHTNI